MTRTSSSDETTSAAASANPEVREQGDVGGSMRRGIDLTEKSLASEDTSDETLVTAETQPAVSWSELENDEYRRVEERADATQPSMTQTSASMESALVGAQSIAPAAAAMAAMAAASLDELVTAPSAELSPEQVDDLEEVRALLPTLRIMKAYVARELGTLDPMPGCEAVNLLSSEAAAVSQENLAETEQEDLADSEADAKEDDGDEQHTNQQRKPFVGSLFVSTTQHLSEGIGLAKSESEYSSDDETHTERPKRQDYVKLSQDMYSLMYFSPPTSFAFFFALGTFMFQMVILTLILVDIVEIGTDNPLNIPAGVDPVVRISQLIALLIAVATQDDLITAINEVHVGYLRRGLRGVVGGNWWQWLLSVSTRFVQGGMCLAVTFILIVQSEDVIGLFLDFLAVTFVSTLDDIMFQLAREGYFARRLKEETDAVIRLRVPRKEIASYLFRPFIFFLVSFAMIAGWVYVVSQQRAGKYLSCGSLSVQFGDEFAATMGFFSGIYDATRFDEGHRPVYLEREKAPAREAGRGMFAYCDDPEVMGWTFSYPSSQSGSADPCHWFARSAETDAYDILEIGSSDWYVYGKEMQGAVPFQHFIILCIDCFRSSDRETCSSTGRCVDNRCVCEGGRYGLNCEFEEPCPSIEIDTQAGKFPGPLEWSDKFHILKRCDVPDERAKVYNRPVYVNDNNGGDELQAIVFTGRRWILARATDIARELSRRSLYRMDECDFAHELMATFHAHWTDFHPEFVSSPTDADTPTDSATPVGLAWYRSKSYNKGADQNAPVSTHLLCSICDQEQNPCNNGGVCGADGECRCRYGTFGTLCQVKNFVLCRNIAVQFGDGIGRSLGGFSGLYIILDDVTIYGRDVYVEERHNHHGAVFAYCEQKSAWTFTIMEEVSSRDAGAVAFLDSIVSSGDSFSNNSISRLFDPCENWKAISPTTDTYDVTSVRTGWYVRHSEKASDGVPFDFFLLWCHDCSRDNIPCSGAGTCGEDNKCVCDEGRYGVSCDIREPCERLVVDQSQQKFEGVMDNQFRVLHRGNGERLTVYYGPVYVSELFGMAGMHANETIYSIILFAGRHWYAMDSGSLQGFEHGTTSTELADYLATEFHAYFSGFQPIFVSEAIDHTFYKSYFPSPANLKWYEPKPFANTRADLDKPTSVKLVCAYCDYLDHPCYNGGECINRKCKCPLQTFGMHCQVDSVCTNLRVFFDEPLPERVHSLGGIYNLTRLSTDFGNRPIYIRAGGGNAMFGFCDERGAWTFTFWGENEAISNVLDPCANYSALSGRSNRYDILSVQSWYVRQNGTSDKFTPVMPWSFFCMCDDDQV